MFVWDYRNRIWPQRSHLHWRNFSSRDRGKTFGLHTFVPIKSFQRRGTNPTTSEFTATYIQRQCCSRLESVTRKASLEKRHSKASLEKRHSKSVTRMRHSNASLEKRHSKSVTRMRHSNASLESVTQKRHSNASLERVTWSTTKLRKGIRLLSTYRLISAGSGSCKYTCMHVICHMGHMVLCT
jgi:hypothetical protein